MDFRSSYFRVPAALFKQAFAIEYVSDEYILLYSVVPRAKIWCKHLPVALTWYRFFCIAIVFHRENFTRLVSRQVAVIGAGVAGLVCARILTRAGFVVKLIEASDGVGGRVRTDVVDGYLLDRGFQVTGFFIAERVQTFFSFFVSFSTASY